MSFHIVCDSCTDLTEEDIKKRMLYFSAIDFTRGWRRDHR